MAIAGVLRRRARNRRVPRKRKEVVRKSIGVGVAVGRILREAARHDIVERRRERTIRGDSHTQLSHRHARLLLPAHLGHRARDVPRH